MRSDFGDEFNAYERKDTPVGFPEQYEIVLSIRDYSYVAGPRLIVWFLLRLRIPDRISL